ncbi:MAG: NAD(P)/FAD-dependent oxidoreductase [Desulfurococcales archaeon]|nr:NAD(P)/FAD-dependent oxidoreductase [Desulfurococcales archaeon]
MAYDAIIVGGGPGGYPAAIRLSELGYKVLLVEEDRLGGECTNYGCVPTKSLRSVAASLDHLSRINYNINNIIGESFSFARNIANDVSTSIESLLASYDVEVVNGRARVLPSKTVDINGRIYEARKAIILSTGSTPLIPQWANVDGRRVHDNRSILNFEFESIDSIAVVGGGYIGVEYSFILARLGLKVTLIEALDRLLPGMDRDFGLLARRMLSRLGVKILLKTPVNKVKLNDKSIEILTSNGSIHADSLLIAIGRVPRNEEARRIGLDLDRKGFVKTNKCGQTSMPGIYAAGDIAGPPLLAHKAMKQAVNVSECINGGKPRGIDPIPQVVFGPVDFVSVGITLEEARSMGLNAVEVRIPVGGLAKSRIYGIKEGFTKIIYNKLDKKIIGIHMAYPDAGESAAIAALIVRKGLTVEEASEVVFPHPTMSEALSEALEAASDRPIHIRGFRVREVKPSG